MSFSSAMAAVLFVLSQDLSHLLDDSIKVRFDTPDGRPARVDGADLPARSPRIALYDDYEWRALGSLTNSRVG